MVRVVRLERTVSWSQTRRDTNFAIPGYSISVIIPRREGKSKIFLSVVIPVVKTTFAPFSAIGGNPANAGVTRLCGISPCPVPDTATALPNIVRLFTFAAIPAIAMLRKSLRWFHRRLSGSGRRIRTLTYGVRVRCATITQSRYVLTNKNYYTHFSEFVNTFFTFFGIVLQTVPFAFFHAL